MVNGESLFSYKARTEKTTPPASKPHRSKAAINTQNTAKAKGPKPLTKAEQWLKDNPPNRQGIVDEVKSMLSPKNLTGANAIQAAIKGDGMSTTERITTGLTGVVQGLSFAAGGAAGEPAVEGVKNTGIPARAVNKITKQEVLLHGRKTSGYSEIKPAGGKYENQPELKKHAYNYFDNPKAPNIAAPKGKSLGVEALPFAHEGGTLYAVRGPRKSFTNPRGEKVNWSRDTVVKSQQNQKVVGSIPINHAAYGDYETQIASMLKRAGVKLPRNK